MTHSTRGITALETIIWIGVTVVVVTGISEALITFYRTSNFAIQEATAVTSVQRGLDTMAKKIRVASYSNVGAYPVVSLAANDFVFYANIDSDSAIERVHFYLSGTTLYQGIVEPSGDPASYTGSETITQISDNIKNASQSVNLFTYYDASGAQITDYTKIGDVRFVTINLVADIDPNRAPTLTSLRTSAAMRNLIY